MIIYLTYNDQPSGVYWSQVTDVVEHLNALGVGRVKLVALVSARGFFDTRRKIRQHSPAAWVIPMVPTMARWRKNTLILAWACRLLKPKAIIARGVMATWMALRMRDRKLAKRVCFDGRGAYAAEWEEYRIIDDDALISQFRPLENEAVNASDFRLAVSNALVAHWRERYGYKGDEHVIIPCTLGKDFRIHPLDAALPWRTSAGIPQDAVLLAYSGSTAGWQSFSLLKELLTSVMRENNAIHVLFLSQRMPEVDALAERFPGRVHCMWLPANQVQNILWECDHGILLREATLTNKVSSPTKFAEYLASGSRVIISPSIGDFSTLVESEDLGIVFRTDVTMPALMRVRHPENERLWKFAQGHFSKNSHRAEYGKLLRQLTA